MPNATNPAVLAVPDGAPRGMYPSHNTWQPRFGFAYTLMDKTTIRGGFGTFYDRVQGNPTMYTLNNPPYVGSVSYQSGNLSNIAGGAAVSAPWGTIQTMDPNLKTPYSEQLSIGIQRELPLHLFTEVDYVGSFGRHLLIEARHQPAQLGSPGAASSTANENYLRPYAGYSIIQQFLSAGTSNYHGLQMRLERRFGRVQFTSAYTFSKNLSDASSDTENNFDAFNIHAMYGPAYSSNAGSSIDVRHTFVGTMVWDLPTLRNRALRPRPVGRLAAEQHHPSAERLLLHHYGQHADRHARSQLYWRSGRAAQPGANGWFNPAAFTTAPQGAWGTCRPRQCRRSRHADLQPLGDQVLQPPRRRKNQPPRARRLPQRVQQREFPIPATTITSSGFGTISSLSAAQYSIRPQAGLLTESGADTLH